LVEFSKDAKRRAYWPRQHDVATFSCIRFAAWRRALKDAYLTDKPACSRLLCRPAQVPHSSWCSHGHCAPSGATTETV